MDGSFFACVGWFPVVHAASLHGFMSVKMSQKKEQERVTPGWTDISRPGPASF